MITTHTHTDINRKVRVRVGGVNLGLTLTLTLTLSNSRISSLCVFARVLFVYQSSITEQALGSL